MAADEAATADIRDFNLIDLFHLEAYQKPAVNYNRDVEVFPVLKRILEKITGGASFYQSPTDMGVNRAGMAIVEDDVTREAAIEQLKELENCEVHMTHIPTPGDEAGLRRLGVNLTSDPNFSSKNLFIS